MVTEINGLPLPGALLAALECGSWKTPVNPSSWRSLVIGEEPRHAMLYNLKMMTSENANWLVIGSKYPSYLGRADAARPPGNVEPAKSLLIGDLGPDKMIALDYRESSSRPSVLLITDDLDGSTRWIRVAPDIETFIHTLGLQAVGNQHV